MIALEAAALGVPGMSKLWLRRLVSCAEAAPPSSSKISQIRPTSRRCRSTAEVRVFIGPASFGPESFQHEWFYHESFGAVKWEHERSAFCGRFSGRAQRRLHPVPAGVRHVEPVRPDSGQARAGTAPLRVAP